MNLQINTNANALAEPYLFFSSSGWFNKPTSATLFSPTRAEWSKLRENSFFLTTCTFSNPLRGTFRAMPPRPAVAKQRLPAPTTEIYNPLRGTSRQKPPTTPCGAPNFKNFVCAFPKKASLLPPTKNKNLGVNPEAKFFSLEVPRKGHTILGAQRWGWVPPLLGGAASKALRFCPEVTRESARDKTRSFFGESTREKKAQKALRAKVSLSRNAGKELQQEGAEKSFLSDFVSIQRKSFFTLLEKGLIEEFSKRNPITNLKKTMELFFYPEYYQLTPPEYSPNQAIILSKSYTSRLYIPVQLTDKTTNLIILKWVYIGNIPLMTKRGHFILNGCARVIVNQMIRSPGLYYQKKTYENYSDKWSEKPETTYERYYADLICNRGTWLRLEIDKYNRIWAQMKRVPPIPIMWFLIAMGLSEKIILKRIIDSKMLLSNFLGMPPSSAGVNEQNLTENQALSPSAPQGVGGRFTYGASTGSIAKNPLRGTPRKIKQQKLSAGLEGKQDQEPSISVGTSTPRDLGANAKHYVKTPPAAWAAIYNLVTGRRKSSKKLLKPSLGEVNTKMNKTQNFAADAPAQAKGQRHLELAQPFVKSFPATRFFLSVASPTPYGAKGVASKALSGLNPRPLAGQPTPTLSKSPTRRSAPQGVGGQKERKHSEIELGRKWIFNKFMNPRTYDLGKVGRLSFNSKLKLAVALEQTTLTPQDLLLATDYLILVSKGLRELDDIDHLKNRRVRTAGELIQLQIGIGLVRLEKTIRENMNKLHAQMLSYRLSSSISKQLDSKRLSTPSKGRRGTFFSRQAYLSKLYLSNFSFSQNRGQGFSCPTLSKSPGEALGWGDRESTNALPSEKLASRGRFFKKEIEKPKKESKLIMAKIMNTKPFNGALKEFFGSSPLSQFMDQINPLAELTHKRRLSSMGPGGVTRDSATLEIRSIHPSHYGRICPVETPEGKNTGLVNSLTAYARVNSNGYIETPFYRVYKGQVQKKAGMFFFSAKQEEKISLGASDLYTSNIGFLPKAQIPVRIAEDFTKIARSDIQYVGVAPIQMISIATSLIPFFEHDDGNRALMGSNMQRQAVPIIKPQRPIVGTGLEVRAVSDSGHVIQAKFSGVVTYLSATTIQIYTQEK